MPATRVSELRAHLRADRERCIADYDRHQNVTRLLRQLRLSVDHAIREVWRSQHLPRQFSLVAVGGYGRGELFPYSDVDILILHPAALSTAEQEQLTRLVSLFWDIGLELGHSVRTPEECRAEAAQDITIQTSLIEARCLAGSRKLFDTMQGMVWDALDIRAFSQAKVLELQQRHAKYQDTPYSLEPDCKESPGGLRDLQVILWISKAAKLGNSWHELAQHGLVSQIEASQLRRNENILKHIRAELHIVAGRCEDRLAFDVQTALAKRMGYVETPGKRASEHLMQRYYLAAKTVTQLNLILLQNIERRLFPREKSPAIRINERFQNYDELLDITAPDVFEREPSAILEAFLLLQQHPEIKDMSARTLRGIWNGRNLIDAKFRRDPKNRALFLQILKEPNGITHALRRMNQWGIIGRYLPVFRRIVGQMQHDLFHVYTVDQHTLMVVRNVRRFTLQEHAHEYPFCSRLIANFDKHWLLYVAALFHDIAKGRGGDHSELGVPDARRFCQQHGIDKEDTALIEFLVRNHLTMSRVAQKQDLSDPDVIRAFAKTVGNERRLTALYLLTVADIRGTSPAVWNAWKGKLLEDLYRLTCRVLNPQGAQNSEHKSELEERRHEALRLLQLHGLRADAHEAFWKQLDVAYFLRLDAQDIAWHTQVLYNKFDTDHAIVKARLAPFGEGIQVLVYVQDQPDLFARLCCYFGNRQFTIQDAKIHTTGNGYALDSFLIAAPDSGSDYRNIIAMVEYELAQALHLREPLPTPVKGRMSRQSKHFPITPSVDLRPDERGRYYLLSLNATDRTGLLYAVAYVLAQHQINVQSAKIMTLGQRVEDVLVINGAELSSGRAQIQLETELLAALSA
ncbi:MAG: [protein-PII] uridylyltransferase [Burkholderiaceae bacterium]|nr:MAG: [protein-PII] uridylyltransferase [Burkholderiaceae bacterium]